MTDLSKPSSDSGSVSDLVTSINRRVDDVLNLLKAQRDLLRRYGMNLPSGSMDSLAMLKRQLEGFGRGLDGIDSELRSLRALMDTAALLISAQETDVVLNQVMDTVISLTRAERGYIVLKNHDTGELEFRVARGMDQATLGGGQEMVISKTIVNRVADSGEPVLTDNASQDERYQQQQSVVGFALRSILAVPLKVRDDVIGVVYCDNRIMAGLFKRSQLDVLSAFASQAAVAIENARLFEATRLRLREVSDMRDRMNNIFNSVASGIITISEFGQVIVHNAAASLITGIDDMIGRSLESVLPPLGEAFDTALAQVRSGGQQLVVTVEPDLPGMGRRMWNMIISPLRDAEAGVSMGITLVLDDLSEQRQREAQLLELRRYLPVALVEQVRSMADIDVAGQERIITTLFADVRGFTSFSERLDPEELMTIINRYLSLASDAINLYQGIVDKYMGDAVTGLYNTQLNPQQDHALRAVQAALQLVWDLRAQHEVMAEEDRLFYGIGIHTGPALLGNVGGADRKEFAALGEAPEVAKYLQEQAEAGEIIISEATRQIIGDTFECERKSEIVRPKPGFENLVFYRVLRRARGGPSPFIDAELLNLLGMDDEA